jgi:predicted SnoaL-like aldol condensation-catalyzing enzyme
MCFLAFSARPLYIRPMARYATALVIAILLQNPDQETSNQQLVLNWYREVITFGHTELAPKYMADTFIDHDPYVTGGPKEFVALYGKAHPRPIQRRLPSPPAIAFSKGDYVVLAWEHPDNDARTGIPYKYFTYDVARVKDGRIQEHWNSFRNPRAGGTPVVMKTTYDVSSLKYTPQEMVNIDVAVAYYRDKDLATPPDLLLAKNDMVLMMYDQHEKDAQDPDKIVITSRFKMVRIEGGKVVLESRAE